MARRRGEWLVVQTPTRSGKPCSRCLRADEGCFTMLGFSPLFTFYLDSDVFRADNLLTTAHGGEYSFILSLQTRVLDKETRKQTDLLR